VSKAKPQEDIERHAIGELLRSMASMAESQKQLVELIESLLAEERKASKSGT
jgi:hypothetical protein